MWKVGDIAMLLYTPSGKSVGDITQILSQLRPAKYNSCSCQIMAGDMVYEIDHKAVNGAPVCIARPEWLGKLPPEETITWDEMADIWSPKELSNAY